jgi:hypothetical protein
MRERREQEQVELRIIQEQSIAKARERGLEAKAIELAHDLLDPRELVGRIFRELCVVHPGDRPGALGDLCAALPQMTAERE